VPVGGEAEHELRAAGGSVGGDRHQVGGVEAREQPGGGPPGPHDRLGLGEGEVEQQQEMAAGRGGDGRGPPGGGHRQVERLEAGDRQPAAAVPDLEVAGLEAAHGLAVAHHLHRHVHRDHLGGAREGRRWRLAVAGRRRSEHQQGGEGAAPGPVSRHGVSGSRAPPLPPPRSAPCWSPTCRHRR
jgi:hypothetical protein